MSGSARLLQRDALIPVPMSCGVPQRAVPTFAIPEQVQAAAEDLKCSKTQFLARGPGGLDVYTAECEDSDVLLSCGAEGCTASEYTTEAQ